MLLKTTRFGEIQIDESQIIEFSEGLIGFHDKKRFVVLEHKQKGPFKWLQSVDEGSLAFIVINPNEFILKYEPDIMKSDLDILQLEDLNHAQIYSTVIVPEDPVKMSANLLGPIVINPVKKVGKQIILSTSKYTTCHYIVDEVIDTSYGVKNAGPLAKAE